jgi:lipoyl-dependent peroxiredoxin
VKRKASAVWRGGLKDGQGASATASGGLKAGLPPDSIQTTATITMEETDAGCNGTQSHLDVAAEVAGADKAKALEIAKAARAGCPVARLLKANITLDARLAA